MGICRGSSLCLVSTLCLIELAFPVTDIGTRYTSIAFGICAMICAIFIPDTRKFQTNRIAVQL